MESYQAIYDATRSRIHGCDVGQAIGDAARQVIDAGLASLPGVLQDIAFSFAQHARPSAVYRPKLSLDGNMYCFLYGDDLMAGVAGFGETAEKAALDFDKNWHALKAPPVMMSADGGRDIPL